jgi:hypothetical protein
MRLEKEYQNNEEDDRKKTKDRRKQENKIVSTLTPEEKYEIAQQEAEALK